MDYSSPIATASGLTWSSPALPAGAVATYAVRAFDTASGLEEGNVDARVTIRLDAAQADITRLPNAPTGLTATATAGATARVTWKYAAVGQGGAPTGFNVYVGTPTPDFGVVAATVPYNAGIATSSATLAGLVDGSVYQISVRSYNLIGQESNVNSVSVTADSTGPAPVGSLTATVVA